MMRNIMICRLYGEEKRTHFSNGMVVDGLHCSKYRENIQLGGHIDLQHFPECQEFPRYEKSQFLHVFISH
jgi:hypothetical protein